MHPAISVIFFTVTSGAGFGFLALIGLGFPLPESGLGAFVTAAIAGGLAVAGLLSSTFHLGHPERAWRAFSQWRSSWLSREGVAAVFTLLLFGVYTLYWMISGERVTWLGWLISVGSIATVYTTSMIYAQLKTVPAWNTNLTPLCYLLFAAACGLLLATSFGYVNAPWPVFLAMVALLSAWLVKSMWWHAADNDTLSARGSSPESATGLGNIGSVRLLEKPHSGENYLTKEMVYKVGRKHAQKLRRIALLLGAFVPLLVCGFVFFGGYSSILLVIAFVFLMAGLFVERWLFFAEAKHAVSLYY